MSLLNKLAFLSLPLLAGTAAHSQNIIIRDVPDYSWFAGCFGTASGNLMGFWDRNGFPDFYTGPTTDGVAPLNTISTNAGIRSMWASRAGFDGRPANQPGHLDNYWEYFEDAFRYSYESSAPDPYQLLGRPEHQPECIGDFIGASQNKWANLDDECSGNIDAFAFNYWDKTGNRRENFVPPLMGGEQVRDIQSGWSAWAHSRGYQADVFSQLVDFNPEVTGSTAFSFEDLKAEINAGYPVMLFLQNPGEFSREFPNMPNGGNPNVHGMIAYGYWETPEGGKAVRYRTSWASGNRSMAIWGPNPFEANLALRGVVGFRPKPQIKDVHRSPDGAVTIKWDGPSASLEDSESGEQWPVHFYQLEQASFLSPGQFEPVGEPVAEREISLPGTTGEVRFFRVKLVPNPARE